MRIKTLMREKRELANNQSNSTTYKFSRFCLWTDSNISLESRKIDFVEKTLKFRTLTKCANYRPIFRGRFPVSRITEEIIENGRCTLVGRSDFLGLWDARRDHRGPQYPSDAELARRWWSSWKWRPDADQRRSAP